MKPTPLDTYEERVVREVLAAALRKRERYVTERRSLGIGSEVGEIAALRKALDLISEIAA